MCMYVHVYMSNAWNVVVWDRMDLIGIFVVVVVVNLNLFYSDGW